MKENTSQILWFKKLYLKNKIKENTSQNLWLTKLYTKNKDERKYVSKFMI